jgi:hypothetical protein
MKGFIAKNLTAATLVGGLSLAAGCDCYRNIVDPCYPQRYTAMAKAETNAAMSPQVSNGHILDQTVWNSHFEPGTDRLTPGGLEHLGYLARRRPCPDSVLFLQTAQDVPYDPAAPDKFAEARAALDTRRIQAVQNYLMADTAGRHLTFEVVVHDPSEVGITATEAGISILKMYSGAQGNLPLTAGAGAGNVAGGGGAGGGGGGAPAGGSGH